MIQVTANVAEMGMVISLTFGIKNGVRNHTVPQALEIQK
jgi:hypothetical protein